LEILTFGIAIVNITGNSTKPQLVESRLNLQPVKLIC